ncbi:MAG: hypothetical protein KDD04_12070, partial [Sinomicrobium sp.]|nr:hypothetical protein [Sinomicrobium sp.]
IGRTNMLKDVKRPLGGEFTLDYARVGNTYALQSSKWVLASVEIRDGVPGDGADTMKNSFEYEDGYYDRHEREFYGFKTVKNHQLNTENNNAIYRSLVQEFINNDYYRQGLPKSETVQDAQGKRYTESINTYQLKDITTGNTLPSDYASNDSGAAFPALTEAKTQFYGGLNTPQKGTRQTYAYDLLGNVTAYTDFADEGPEDDLSAQITYHAVAAPYIMNVPKSIVVTSNGQTYRKREADIDNATGLVTQIRQFSDNSTSSNYDMSYDPYGNLSSINRPQNAQGERL